MAFLFGNAKSSDPLGATAAADPVRMPVTTDSSVRFAARRARQRLLDRSGRSSTILTPPSLNPGAFKGGAVGGGGGSPGVGSAAYQNSALGA